MSPCSEECKCHPVCQKCYPKHKAINYTGSHITPNANLPHERRTSGRADCGVMYTNQARGAPAPTAECQDLSEAELWLARWWGRKSNNTHARETEQDAANETRHRGGHNGTMRKDRVGVLLSWINIRGSGRASQHAAPDIYRNALDGGAY